jgi:acyl carrier protein
VIPDAEHDLPHELASMEPRVRQLILERLHIEVPSQDTDLFSTGIIDSLGLVELLLGLREDLGVEIDIETVDLVELATTERIARTVLSMRRVP